MNRRASFPPAADAGCQAFSQAAMLRVDRELGPAETALLDEHLAVCPACRAKAAQAEALSAVLKRWDSVQTARVQAPTRLRTALLAAVEPEGQRRRTQFRLVRLVRLATAAAVVIALGTGLLFGMLREEPEVRSVAAIPAAPRPEGSVALTSDVRPAREPLPGVAVPVAVPSRLAGLVIDTSRPAEWLSIREYEEFGERLALGAVRREIREAFERDCGEDAVWYTGRTGEERLITISALAHLRSMGQGKLAVLDPARRDTRTIAEQPSSVDTGLRMGDFLGLPTRRDHLETVLRERQHPILGKDKSLTGLVSVVRGSTHEEPRSRLPRAVDLRYAVEHGTVTLREGADDDLVAIVNGARHPIFVPAGELIAGGRVDRIVMRGLWIPATSSVRPVLIPCAPASSPGGSHGEVPAPTGMIAGPGIRSLLGGGASAADVQTEIVKRVPILDTWGGEYSLLGFYDRAAQRENLRILTRIFLARNARGVAARGYVMTDPNGDFVDAEICDLPVESAAPLLARLLVGHASEVRMNRLLGEAATGRKGLRPPEVLLLDLIGSGATFITAGGAEDVRVLRMVEPLTGAVLDVVEHRKSKRAVLASAMVQ